MAIALLIVVPGIPVLLPADAASTSTASASLANAAALAHAAPDAAAVPAPASPSALPCQAVLQGWLSYYSTGIVPPVVSGTDTPGCVPGADDVGLSLVSNQSGSGSRPEVSIALPSTSSYDAGSLAAFWVALAVSGVPCSLSGQSVLRVEFLPPTDPLGSGPPSLWQVRAPVWDLVSPGSCDPQCQNASALFEIDGARFCEDDAVLYGPNGRGGAPVDYLSSGDIARIEVGGGGSAPLTVYLNDTTRPSESATWRYPAAVMASGTALAPWSTAASPSSAWTFGGTVSVGWTSCPVLNRSFEALPCNSYAQAQLGGIDYPALSNSSYWNPASHAFNAPYPTLLSWSSSGACSGHPGVSGCDDFQSVGGFGEYPSVSVYASHGSAWIGYGPNDTDRIAPLATSLSGFASDGSTTTSDPAVLTGFSSNVTNNSITLSARATDPRGIGQVVFGALWCFDTASTTPGFFALRATEGIGVDNGTQDGSYTAVLPRGANTTGGLLRTVARIYQSSGVPAGPADYGVTLVPGMGPVCGPPISPPAVIASATPLASGYRVTWSYPAQYALQVRNFSLLARVGPVGPILTVPVPGGPDARSADIVGLLPGQSYNVYVGATALDGTTLRSNPFNGSMTLGPLLANATVGARSLWQPGAVLNVTGNASGGLGPYCLFVDWGDGTNSTDCAASGGLSASHPYLGYFGSALVGALVNDSAGDVAGATSALVIVRATPLGVTVTAAAGDGIVDLNWTAPPSPSGPVTGYVVFFTTDPVAATDLTVAWPSNVTGPHPVFLRNTTGRSLDELPVRNGATLYAEVIAWDSYGAGLESSAGRVSASPAPLSLSFVPGPTGGPAPYTTSLSAIATTGTPDPIVSAVFFASGLPSVAAQVRTIGGTSWINASYTFPHPGVVPLTVHIVDALDESTANTTDVYVGAGAAPLLDLAILTPSPYEGRPVSFQATVSDGVGPYNFSWTFGDGAQSFDSGPSAVHTYAAAGVSSVTVSVTDNSTGGATSATRAVHVYQLPSVSISSAVGASGALSFTFRAVVVGGSGPSIAEWSFGDAARATGLNVTHSYSATGTYTVSVVTTDPTGLGANASVQVYAGLPKASSPLLGGPTGVALLLIVAALAVVLAASTAYLYGRTRSLKARETERSAEPKYPEFPVEEREGAPEGANPPDGPAEAPPDDPTD